LENIEFGIPLRTSIAAQPATLLEATMASAFSHAFAAVALGKAYGVERPGWKFWGLAIASAVLPDVDVLSFGFGIKYGDMLGHRGLTHSLFAALVWGFLVVWCEFKEVPHYSRKWWSLFAFYFVVTASHGVLDAFTNGGLGVGFFIPFSSARYFFPWHGIEVSPLTLHQFFTAWGGAVIRSELKYIWLPCSLLWLVAWSVRKYRKTAKRPPA
jgi:inner membrane protein